MTRLFCWHQNFVPWGLYDPVPGLYTCIKSWKNYGCWHQSVAPRGLSVPAPGLYTCIKSWKKKCIKSDFKEIFLKHATNDRSGKMCLLTSKFRPQWVVGPCPGAICMYKIMKKMYKIRLQRDSLKLATEERREKMFLLTSKFRPQGVVSPWPGAIYMSKIMKKEKSLKSDFKHIFFKLVANNRRGFCWRQNFAPWRCLPLTCGYIHLLNHEKMCIKSEVEEIHFKLAITDHSDEAFLLT